MDPPPIRYARVGADRVAYQVLGDGPPDLVYCSVGSEVSFVERRAHA